MFDIARRIIKFIAGALLVLAIAVVMGAYFFLPWPGLRPLSGPPPLLAFDANVGSGFFVDAGGHVLTNHHVVRNCRRITLAGPNFRAAPATLVATASDPLVDLALLHADSQLAPAALALSPEPWPAAPVGNSLISSEEVADAMKAAGLAETGSAKVVGYPTANRGQAPDIIPVQTLPAATTSDRRHWLRRFDGALMQGSSGSPVINEQGEVIGVATALVADLDKTTRQLEPGGLEQTGYGIKGRHGLMTPAAIIRNFLNETRVSVSASNKGAGEPTAAVVRVFCFQTWPAGW